MKTFIMDCDLSMRVHLMFGTIWKMENENHTMEELRLFDVVTVYPLNLSMSTPAIRTSCLWIIYDL